MEKTLGEIHHASRSKIAEESSTLGQASLRSTYGTRMVDTHQRFLASGCWFPCNIFLIQAAVRLISPLWPINLRFPKSFTFG